jgi:signal transduction histidine kinase
VELSSFPLASDGDGTGPKRRVIVLRDVTEARRRDLLRDAFLSLLSHELRTPMTAVYGGATLLQRVGDQLDSTTRNELRDDIVAEAERLSRLIDDLLVLTRVEGGVEVGLEPALLQHLVAEVVAQDRRAYGESRITIAVESGLSPVIGDETSIRQVVHNLISNAVKYSPGASVVETSVEAADGEVVVRVLDRGRGLSEGEAAHVFEPFYRGRTTERMAPGIGIGLFVCQRLVEAMGGRIWSRPRDGGGTEFGFALQLWPIDADDQPAPEPGIPVRSGSSW